MNDLVYLSHYKKNNKPSWVKMLVMEDAVYVYLPCADGKESHKISRKYIKVDELTQLWSMDKFIKCHKCNTTINIKNSTIKEG